MLSVALAFALATPAQAPPPPPGRSILAFSKTAGFRHDSIPAARKALLDVGIGRGWTVSFTEDARVFEPGRLKAYDAVVFLMTTGDVLDKDQEKALTGFIRGGGGYAGVHAAADTEYDWAWYGQLVGGYFMSHPAIQDAKVKVEDRSHPSTAHLPAIWARKDEWYDYKASPRGKVQVLASLDPASYTGWKMEGDHPIMWCHEFEGGRSWYTGMGHTQESYQDPIFVKMIAEGIEWACGKSKRVPKTSLPLGAKLVSWKGTRGWFPTGDVLANSGPTPEHLCSAEEYGDAQVHVEFKLPKGSNSGVYLQGRYEIQIFDSAGVKDLTFADCGGVYQRWKNEAGYEGNAPLVNAYQGPDKWNAFDISFTAPRFDSAGRKVANARFGEVKLNGVVVQRNVTVTGPTRASYFEDEKSSGPLYLQSDHGPVEFRNVWVRPVRR